MDVYSFSKNTLEDLMRVVIDEVKIAISEGNAPFAAILIDKDGNIIDKAHNTVNSDCNPVMHAEINLIMKVCKKFNTKDLSDYCLVSNAWSCSMCMSASIKAKISSFIFGVPSEPNMTPNITIFDIIKNTNRHINVISGILEEDCKLQIMNARSIK